MRKNVLIYPGNGYNALEVYNCLKFSLRYKPLLGNSGYTHGEFITEDCYTNLPNVHEADFVEKINLFISEHSISFIIPTHDTVCVELMRLKEKINAKIICSSYEVANICRHKSLTYNKLKETDFLPAVYDNIEDIYENDYPIFVKDDIGQGGKNSFKADSLEELRKGLENNSAVDYVITEFLPGTEITIDCFTDRRGVLLFSQPRERVTILNGMSGMARNIDLTEEILHISSEINRIIRFRGYWYIQCRKDKNGKYRLMEISTRFAGTFALSANLDVNFPLLALTDAEEIDVKIVPNKYRITSDRGYIVRYRVDIDYEIVYFDFDDTLVYDREKYIPLTFAFLLQCKNAGKSVELITRHSYDIHNTLKNLHIDEGLFDQIIEVSENRSKADYICKEKKSILIDNSFRDRLEVKEKCGIPTFDIYNIESLLRT